VRVFLYTLIALVPAARLASGATVLFCPFDSIEGWEMRSLGATQVATVGKTEKSRCVGLTARRGTVFLTRELPLGLLKGSQVTVSCSVKGEGVVRGPQLCSTAKVHLAVQTPSGTQHHSARFLGTSDWHQEGFTADVPGDAQRVRLNVGLESCSGKALFSRLIVRNDQRGVHCIDLASAANAEHGQLGISALPPHKLEWEGVPFELLDAAEGGGVDCMRLRGSNHPDWPARTAAPIWVNTGASSIYIFHAALDGKATRETPCAIWTATFAGGHTASLSVFEGRQIGAVGQTEDCENWQVAWRAKGDQPVTFGVTKWTVYSETPIQYLSCRAYRGAAPVVLAITVVEEPPPKESDEAQEDDEWYLVE